MGVVANRPFVPSAQRTSNTQINNNSNYAICAMTWVNNKGDAILYQEGCHSLEVKLPVPEPEEPEEDPQD